MTPELRLSKLQVSLWGRIAQEGKKSVFQKEGTEISKGHRRWEPYNSYQELLEVGCVRSNTNKMKDDMRESGPDQRGSCSPYECFSPLVGVHTSEWGQRTWGKRSGRLLGSWSLLGIDSDLSLLIKIQK